MRFGAFALGLLLVLAGSGVSWLAGSGAVTEGKAGAYLVGAGLIALAVPLLAFLASYRLAKTATFALLTAFAVAMLWASFGSSATTPTTTFQVVAVVFNLLVLLRIFLAVRRARSAHGA